MKLNSVARLSFKNIMDNKTRFFMSLAILILLSTVIIILGNAIIACKRSIDSNLINSANENGINIEIRANYLTTEHIDKFVDVVNGYNTFDEYIMQISNSIAKIEGQSAYIKAFYGGKQLQNADFKLTEGETWGASDNDKRHVWICQSANIDSKEVGDTVSIILDDSSTEFIIKGIVTGETSYISYKMVRIRSFHIFLTGRKYENMAVYRNLRAIDLELTNMGEGRIITGRDLENYKMSTGLFYGLLVICSILILICLLFSVGCIVNAFRMSVENNNKSMGILRAIGMSNGNIYWYIIMQQLVVMLVATIIALIIAAILSKICLPIILTSLLGMAFNGIELMIVTAISGWAIVLNFILLTLVLLIGSSRVMKKYFKGQVIKSL